MTIKSLPPTPLELSSYASAAKSTDRFADAEMRVSKLQYGLFGEIGGLLAALKKVSRDDLLETDTQVAAEELGDALWYLFATAESRGISSAELGAQCIRNLRRRLNECERPASNALTFRQIDGLVSVHNRPTQELDTLLSELAKSVGDLVYGPSNLLESLGNILALIALISSSFRLTLENIAEENLIKIKNRWPGKNPEYIPLFDSNFPDHEQLPRHFEIEFIERDTANTKHVVQRLNKVYIGDRLTDNSHEEDDYRFHDVFHLAYLTHLGWSPVIRALLKVKRKSKPDIDEREDGARAIIIEEGIATWIFNHAKVRENYINVAEGKLDYSLLKQVHSMVKGYEVEICPLWQWEKAILEGFRIFRELRSQENRGGIVSVDMEKHSLTYQPALNIKHEL